MGATDPAKADAGTLRKEFAQSIERNATHGSDAPDTAAYEIGYFFAGRRARFEALITTRTRGSGNDLRSVSLCPLCD